MEKITSKQYAAKIVEVAYHEVLPNKEVVCNIINALIQDDTDILGFNHIANRLVYQFTKSED